MIDQDSLSRGPAIEGWQARFAMRITARLSEQSEFAAHDVSERLRFAREKAMERSRLVRTERQTAAVASTNGGSGANGATLRLHPGAPNSGWWVRFGSVLPLAALVLGLVFIQNLHSRSQISAAAEVDAELLGDAVPVAAYGDPGFVEFLKAARD